MKRVLTVLVTVFLAVCLFVSCNGEAPVFVSVSFDSNGGSKVKSQDILIGETAVEPSVPTKEGYDFQGWLYNGTVYDFSTAVNEDITLKALWKAQKRTVKFNSNGGTSSYEDIEADYDSYISEPKAPEKSGWTFIGWYNGDTKYDFNTVIKSDFTLTAKWGYKVTFDSDNGEAPVIVYLESAGPIAAGKVADPEKEKFKFEGWYKEDGTKFEFGKTEVTADGLKLTAKWNPTYTCIVNYNRTEDGIPNDYYEVIEGYKFHFTDSDKTGSWDITELAKKYNVKYDFVGWYYDGVLYTPESELWKNTEIIVKQPVTLTAAWADKTKFHTVTFVDDDGTTPLLSKSKVEDGKTVYIPEGWAPSKDDAVFLCWTKDGAEYNVKSPVTEDITLKASWKRIWEVKFTVDGGNYVVKDVGDGDTVSAPDAPEKSGYIFMGWYDGESRFDFNSEVTDNKTLTAKWGYSVAFTVSGAADSYAVPVVQEVVENGTATKPDTDPVSSFVGDNKYKTFAYWSLDGKTEYKFTEAVTENITLVAVWRDLKFGDRGPANGWIFYDVDADNDSGNKDGLISSVCGWRYLEAAESDLTNGSDNRFAWGSKYTYGSTRDQSLIRTEIGAGKDLTDYYRSHRGGYFYAAEACYTYTSSNGVGGWFLPSRNELMAMYALMTAGKGNFDWPVTYWSSSVSNQTGTGYKMAIDVSFYRYDSEADSSLHTARYHLRPARRF